MSRQPPGSVGALFERHCPATLECRGILWNHSSAVATRALEIAKNFSARRDFLEEAAWLHDLGIVRVHAPGIGCFGEMHYLWHGVIGREMCDEAGLPEHGLVCERHVGTGLTVREVAEIDLGLPMRDMLPISLEEQIVCYADQFFSKSTTDPLPLDEVRRRVGRHGEAPLQRFEELHQKFAQ